MPFISFDLKILQVVHQLNNCFLLQQISAQIINEIRSILDTLIGIPGRTEVCDHMNSVVPCCESQIMLELTMKNNNFFSDTAVIKCPCDNNLSVKEIQLQRCFNKITRIKERQRCNKNNVRILQLKLCSSGRSNTPSNVHITFP